jgi:hypothetical protein
LKLRLPASASSFAEYPLLCVAILSSVA